MVELAEEGLSITLRENRGEVPFKINFRASAVENNAASCFFLFPQFNPCYGCGGGRMSKLVIEFLDRFREKMAIPGGRKDIALGGSHLGSISPSCPLQDCQC